MGVAMLSLVVAVGAQAKRGGSTPVNVGSKLVIHELTPNRARGEVSAKVNECEAKRTVVLFAISNGAGPDVRVGKDITSEKGIWEIREPLASGPYTAVVGMDRKGDFLCDLDHANPVTLP